MIMQTRFQQLRGHYMLVSDESLWIKLSWDLSTIVAIDSVSMAS